MDALARLDTWQLVALAAALGLASGLRLYAVLFVVGAAGYLGWVDLPSLRLWARPLRVAGVVRYVLGRPVQRGGMRTATAAPRELHGLEVRPIERFGPELDELGALIRVRTGLPEITAHADQKHLMRERAQALGIPVAEGEVATLAHAGGRRRCQGEAP